MGFPTVRNSAQLDKLFLKPQLYCIFIQKPYSKNITHNILYASLFNFANNIPVKEKCQRGKQTRIAINKGFNYFK